MGTSRCRGAKRAAVAVGHSLLVIVYFVIGRGDSFRDLGTNYFDERDRDQIRRRLTRRLEALGYEVSVNTAA